MAKNIFAEWNKSIDTEGLKKDIEEAKENGGGGTREEVPAGTYEVGVDKMELKPSKKNQPMLTVWFKVLDGKFKNSIIFYNQVVLEGFQIHLALELLRSMVVDQEIEFDNYEQFNELVETLCEKIDEEGLEFALKYGENQKGFKTFEIEEVFEG